MPLRRPGDCCGNCECATPINQPGLGLCQRRSPTLHVIVIETDKRTPKGEILIGQKEQVIQDRGGWPVIRVDQWCAEHVHSGVPADPRGGPYAATPPESESEMPDLLSRSPVKGNG